MNQVGLVLDDLVRLVPRFLEEVSERVLSGRFHGRAVSIVRLRMECDQDAYPLTSHLESVLSFDERGSQEVSRCHKAGERDESLSVEANEDSRWRRQTDHRCDESEIECEL